MMKTAQEKVSRKVTLAQAQAAAKDLFREAAAMKLLRQGRRYYASNSEYFSPIEALDPSRFAEFAVWLIGLVPRDCPERWDGYGSVAADQLRSYAFKRLSQSRDDALSRLLKLLRSHDFRRCSLNDAIAILESLVERQEQREIKTQLLEGSRAMVDRFDRWPYRRKSDQAGLRKLRRLHRELIR